MQVSQVKIIVFSVVLLGIQTFAGAVQGAPISGTPTQQFSRDLVQTDSQDFFRQGNARIEREIQVLQRRRLPVSGPLLKINVVPVEDRLPSNTQSN